MQPDTQKYAEGEPKVIRVQEIPPAEYTAIKKRYKENVQRVEELEEKCRMLEDALKYGEVTTLSRMIMEYQAMSVSYLEHISKEMQIYRYSYEERQQGMEFISYLRNVAFELEGLLWPGGINA
ncbi:hypothetical protein [Selenomonas ruminantium]|uniref:Uncharacterized protein n=1 Tax=Selenomonas ruminantium TaxID=971 RepID=A0A1H3VSU0_SELRU|nr:hypothetical protein [Selenomonas ruminantium]SDZ77905.1 hypothetical protein SAMN05660648_00552 [Selenomonas ruminantium]